MTGHNEALTHPGALGRTIGDLMRMIGDLKRLPQAILGVY